MLYFVWFWGVNMLYFVWFLGVRRLYFVWFLGCKTTNQTKYNTLTLVQNYFEF